MKHTNDVNNIEEGQNVNTLSEIEEYYKAREQQLLKKLHRQEAALAAAEQTLKRLTENQKAPMDETTEQRTAQEQAFKEKLYRDPLTGIYNRRYYEEVVRKSIGPAGIALMDVDDFKICNDTYGHYAGDMALKTVANTIQSCIRDVGPAHPLWRRRISAGVIRHSGRLFADQTGTDPHRRADGICTRLFAFPYLAEHWRNDTVPRRPYGKHRSPGGLADVSGKVPQECRHGGGSWA